MVPRGSDHLLPRQQAQAGAEQPGAGKAGIILQLRCHPDDRQPAAADTSVHWRLHRPPVPATCKLTSGLSWSVRHLLKLLCRLRHLLKFLCRLWPAWLATWPLGQRRVLPWRIKEEECWLVLCSFLAHRRDAGVVWPKPVADSLKTGCSLLYSQGTL